MFKHNSHFNCFVMVKVSNRIQPPVQVIVQGELSQLTCSLEGVLTWYFNGSTLPTNAIPSENDLYILNAGPLNQGYYECLGYNGKLYLQAEALLVVIGIYYNIV